MIEITAERLIVFIAKMFQLIRSANNDPIKTLLIVTCENHSLFYRCHMKFCLLMKFGPRVIFHGYIYEI